MFRDCFPAMFDDTRGYLRKMHGLTQGGAPVTLNVALYDPSNNGCPLFNLAMENHPSLEANHHKSSK